MDSRPFVIEALDIDALIEVKPEGKVGHLHSPCICSVC